MRLSTKRRATDARSYAIDLGGALTIEPVSGHAEGTVRVSGRLVIDSSPTLRATLLQLLGARVNPVVVIDLTAVSYLDTSGVATLIEAARLAHTHATRLRVTGMAGEPKMLAQVTEMDAQERHALHDRVNRRVLGVPKASRTERNEEARAIAKRHLPLSRHCDCSARCTPSPTASI